MRPHPRIRKVVKWGGLGVAVLLLAVWIDSGWRKSELFYMDVGSRPLSLALGSGVLELCAGLSFFPADEYPYFLDEPGWSFSKGNGNFNGYDWRIALHYPHDKTGDYFLFRVPLWCPFLLLLMPTAWAWRLDLIAARRIRRGLCRTCNYDLSGLSPGTPCPECGKSASTPSAS